MTSWYRLPAEGEDAYEAFKAFLFSKPPRRILANIGLYSTEQVAGWANQHTWVERATDFDNYLMQVRQAEIEAVMRREGREIASGFLMVSHELLQVVEAETAKLIKASKLSEHPGLVKVSEISKLAEAAMKLDRVYRELPTERTEGEDIDRAACSPEQLLELAKMPRVKK